MRLQTISFLLAALCCSGCGRSRVETTQSNQIVVGKLLIQIPAVRISRANRANDDTEKFLEDQMMALRGPKLRSAAEEMLLKEHATWKPSEVKLEIARVRGGSVISLVGRGGANDCARALINLIMDGYLTTVGSDKPNASNLKDETSRTEKGLQEAELAWNSFKLNNDLAHAASNLASLQRRLKQFTAARLFYQNEMESSASLSLEQDIERRKISSNLPPDMPAEFAAIARVTPTASELAYLAVIRQSNAAATEAARKEATNDREARLDSHRRQVEILNDLMGGIQTNIANLSAVQQQARVIEQSYISAESTYKMAKSREMNDGMSPDNSVTPSVMASVVERASVTTDGK